LMDAHEVVVHEVDRHHVRMVRGPWNAWKQLTPSRTLLRQRFCSQRRFRKRNSGPVWDAETGKETAILTGSVGVRC
jgi:hypothetical protein